MRLDGIVPGAGQTALSQLAHQSFGTGPAYAYVQGATAVVLLLAANSAFNGFPRLLSFMARNGHAPRVFLRLGERLAFSNGTIALAVGAALLFLAFAGRTAALIPLYAVGVFVAFTFSQAGMAVHWCRREAHWRRSMVLNAGGSALSAIVFVIASVTKFSHGSWVALVLIALIALLTWRIRVHYDAVHGELALRLPGPGSPHRAITPAPLQPALAVHLSPNEDEAARFRGYRAAWGDHLPLEVVDSPYRAVVAPMARYIDALRSQRAGLTVTVILPELIVKHRWHRPLHNGIARRLRRALRRRPGLVITTVPHHLAT